MKNERLLALKLLTDLLENHHSLAQLLPSGQDTTAMTRELCFGFCRHYFRLQAIALRLVDKKPKDMTVWVALLIGLYQLHYMKTPDYAVVKETVALLEKTKKGWAKGLINAVLRRFCREQDTILAALKDEPAFVHGQSPTLLKYFKQDWPQDWQKIAAANDAHPPMTLRVNTQRVSVTDYLNLLQENDITASAHAIAAEGINLAKPCDVYSLPGFEDGMVSVQDGAAQLAVSLLDLKPGLSLLDACCAPGGKTSHILEAEPNLAQCVALDIEPKRLIRVKENLARLHLQAQVVQGDALSVDSWWDNHLFDRILLDAPCSAVGVQRRHADIKLLRTDEEIETIIEIQQGMLESLWPLLAPGGLMVYATCSIISNENENQIAAFVGKHNDCLVVKNDLRWGRDTGHGRQILPGEHGMDGFFYSVLIKEKI